MSSLHGVAETYDAVRKDYNVSLLDMQSGLPSNSVTDMLEDSFGFIWIASDVGGLVRFDGYSTLQPSEYILNAEIQKLLFKKKVTLAVKGYDILGQSKNLTVTDNANYHSEVLNNTLGRYIIVSLTWRFGTMNKDAMGGMGGFGGPGGRGGFGGPGGPRR